MASCNWANHDSVGVFPRNGMISGLWGELVLLQGKGIKLRDQNILQSCREGYCVYGPAAKILCWVYHVLGESCFTCLTGPMSSKADSRFVDP